MKKFKEYITEVGPHYDEMNNEDRPPDEYHARNITWHGYKGRMIKLYFDNTYPMWGNIFDSEKIKETAEAIRNSEEQVHFDAPLCDPSIITIDDIIENLREREEDKGYDPTSDTHTNELTTGDVELDEYLRDGDDFLDSEYGVYIDEDEAEITKEYYETKREFEEKKQTAINEQWGDIGALYAQIRDGNHRRAAASLAGEPYFYGLVVENTMQRIRQGQEPELKEYLI